MGETMYQENGKRKKSGFVSEKKKMKIKSIIRI